MESVRLKTDNSVVAPLAGDEPAAISNSRGPLTYSDMMALFARAQEGLDTLAQLISENKKDQEKAVELQTLVENETRRIKEDGAKFMAKAERLTRGFAWHAFEAEPYVALDLLVYILDQCRQDLKEKIGRKGNKPPPDWTRESLCAPKPEPTLNQVLNEFSDLVHCVGKRARKGLLAHRDKSCEFKVRVGITRNIVVLQPVVLIVKNAWAMDTPVPRHRHDTADLQSRISDLVEAQGAISLQHPTAHRVNWAACLNYVKLFVNLNIEDHSTRPAPTQPA